jgi:hypothetical protein
MDGSPKLVKFDGDTLHQKGALASGLKIEEVWERITKN